MRKDVNILLVEDDDVDAENVIRAFKSNNIANPLMLCCLIISLGPIQDLKFYLSLVTHLQSL